MSVRLSVDLLLAFLVYRPGMAFADDAIRSDTVFTTTGEDGLVRYFYQGTAAGTRRRMLKPLVRRRRRDFCLAGADDDLERLGFRCSAKGIVGIEDPIQGEAVRDKQRRVQLFGGNGAKQHAGRGCVHQPGGNRDVV